MFNNSQINDKFKRLNIIIQRKINVIFKKK